MEVSYTKIKQFKLVSFSFAKPPCKFSMYFFDQLQICTYLTLHLQKFKVTKQKLKKMQVWVFFPNQTCSQLLHIFKSAKVVLSSRKLTYCLMLPFIAQHLPTMPYTSIAQWAETWCFPQNQFLLKNFLSAVESSSLNDKILKTLQSPKVLGTFSEF